MQTSRQPPVPKFRTARRSLAAVPSRCLTLAGLEPLIYMENRLASFISEALRRVKHELPP